MVVVEIEVIIHSGGYLSISVEPNARGAMEVGPQIKAPLCAGSQHYVSLSIGNLCTSSISGRSRRDCAYLHREFKQLITKAILFFYYYFLQTKLINHITQDAHYAKLN